jgi:Skp family chaperone for outer membrane proteins
MEPEKNTSSKLPMYFSIAALAITAVMLIFSFMKHGDMSANNGTDSITTPKNGHSIAYINTDTILKHYELVKELGDKLEEKTVQYEKEITGKQAEFEKEAAYFQESVRKNSLSENSAKEIYQKLMDKQQSIVEQKDYYSRQLSMEENRIP